MLHQTGRKNQKLATKRKRCPIIYAAPTCRSSKLAYYILSLFMHVFSTCTNRSIRGRNFKMPPGKKKLINAALNYDVTTQTYRALRVSQLQVHAWNYGRHEQNDCACTLPACSEKRGDQTLVRRRSRRTQSLHQPSQANARTHKQNARTPERQGRTTRAVVAAAVRTPEQLTTGA